MEIMSVAAFIGGAVWSMFASQRVDAKGVELQREILKRGERRRRASSRCGVRRLIGSFPRVYFEFEPDGSCDDRFAVVMSIAVPTSGFRCFASCRRYPRRDVATCRKILHTR